MELEDGDDGGVREAFLENPIVWFFTDCFFVVVLVAKDFIGSLLDFEYDSPLFLDIGVNLCKDDLSNGLVRRLEGVSEEKPYKSDDIRSEVFKLGVEINDLLGVDDLVVVEGVEDDANFLFDWGCNLSELELVVLMLWILSPWNKNSSLKKIYSDQQYLKSLFQIPFS